MKRKKSHYTTKHTHLKSVSIKNDREKCSLCGNKLDNEFGNNPFPLIKRDSDRCCNSCNESYVIPSRLCLIFPKTKILLNKKGWFKDITGFIEEMDKRK